MTRDDGQALREAVLRFMGERRLRVFPWAKRAGLADNTLRNFLVGKSKSLTYSTLEQLARAAEVSVDTLTGGTHRKVQEITRVPVIDYVQAGNWREVVDAYQPGHGFADIVPDRRVGPNAFALEIVGDSMEPDFREGDRIVIDPDVRPRPGDFVVAKVRPADEATFKRYTTPRQSKRGKPYVELVPLNPAYPVLTMSGQDDEIVGTVVEHHRYFRR